MTFNKTNECSKTHYRAQRIDNNPTPQALHSEAVHIIHSWVFLHPQYILTLCKSLTPISITTYHHVCAALFSLHIKKTTSMTIGGLSLHQIQPFKPPHSPPILGPAQFSEQRSTDASPSPPSLHHLKSIQDFKQAHAYYIKHGLARIPQVARELLWTCALSEWAGPDYAQPIFTGLDCPATFDFNIMIRAYVNHSDPTSALEFYQELLERDIRPDNFTFPFVLKACAQLSAIREGMQVHGQALKFGVEDDVFVRNSLINLYGKCEEIGAACRVFEAMRSTNRTVASWSSLLAAHGKAGLWSEIIDIFSSMLSEGIQPDKSSLVCVLSSCSHLGSLHLGRRIHCWLIRQYSSLNVIVLTSLIDMYIKCGLLEKGLTIFNQMPEKNRWTYSVVISGLAMHGAGEKGLEIFDKMTEDGITPDEAIYVGVLTACSSVEQGLKTFNRMQLEHQLLPRAQHYGCLVDLMGRVGKLDEAHSLIRRMPIGLPTDVAWRSLLSACRVHGDLKLAELALENLVELNRAKAGDYVILSNTYANFGKWDDAAKTRTEITSKGMFQVPGVSRVELNGKMHTFVSNDRSHPQCHEIYEMLYQMEWQLRFEGYKLDTSEVLLNNVGEEEKMEVARGHSQKLAIAFGLLNTRKWDTIRVFTNLRICSECHTYSRLISTIFKREIVVRDRNQFHNFKEGVCSCRGYW